MTQAATVKVKFEMRYFMRRTLSIFSVAKLYVASAHADSSNDICKVTDEVFSFATNQLKSEVGEEKCGLCEVDGAAYIAKKSNGMSMVKRIARQSRITLPDSLLVEQAFHNT